MSDHVDAISEAVRAAGAPVVLAVHSGTGASGYGASDRVPELIAAMVYVELRARERRARPEPHRRRAADALAGGAAPRTRTSTAFLRQQLETFRDRAVPEPAGPVREAAELTNDARRDVPSTVICTGATSEQIKAWAEEGYAWLGGLPELRNVTWSTCRRATGRCGLARRARRDHRRASQRLTPGWLTQRFSSQTIRSPSSVRCGSIRSSVCACGAIRSASPPVATVCASTPSSSRMRPTMPSTWPAKP